LFTNDTIAFNIALPLASCCSVIPSGPVRVVYYVCHNVLFVSHNVLCSNQTKSNGGLQCVMHVGLPKQQKFSLNTHSDKSVYPSDFGFAK